MNARLVAATSAFLILSIAFLSCGGPLYEVYRERGAGEADSRPRSGDRGREERLRHRYATKERLPGIPFFALEMVERTTAVYEQEYFELKLTTTFVKLDEKKEPVPDTTFQSERVKYTVDQRQARLLHATFSANTNAVDAVDAVQGAMGPDSLANFPAVKLVPPPQLTPRAVHDGVSNLRLASVQRQRLAVPATELRYINVGKAATGTSQGTITLNENGTLASANAQTVDETMKTLLTSLPASAIVAKAFGVGPAPPQFHGEMKAAVLAATFTITPVVRRYVVSIDQALTSGSPSSEIPNGDTQGATVQITVARGDSPAPEKTDDASIGFSGKVTLPKPKPSEKGK